MPDSWGAHGSPPGEVEVTATERAYGWLAKSLCEDLETAAAELTQSERGSFGGRGDRTNLLLRVSSSLSTTLLPRVSSLSCPTPASLLSVNYLLSSILLLRASSTFSSTSLLHARISYPESSRQLEDLSEKPSPLPWKESATQPDVIRRLAVSSMLQGAKDVESLIEHPGRPKCRCRCGCRRRPGRRVGCPMCGRLVGPGCCLRRVEGMPICHVCLLAPPPPADETVKGWTVRPAYTSTLHFFLA